MTAVESKLRLGMLFLRQMVPWNLLDLGFVSVFSRFCASIFLMFNIYIYIHISVCSYAQANDDADKARDYVANPRRSARIRRSLNDTKPSSTSVAKPTPVPVSEEPATQRTWLRFLDQNLFVHEISKRCLNVLARIVGSICKNERLLWWWVNILNKFKCRSSKFETPLAFDNCDFPRFVLTFTGRSFIHFLIQHVDSDLDVFSKIQQNKIKNEI